MTARHVGKGGVLALALLVAPFVVSPAHALPSFARGQGTPCGSCHVSGQSQLDQRNLLKSLESETAPAVATVDLLPVTKQLPVSATLSLHTTINDGASALGRSAPQERLRLIAPEPNNLIGLSGMSGQVKYENFDASVGFFGDGEGQNLVSSFSDPKLWYRLGYSPRFGSLGLAVGLFGESASRSIIDREQGNGFARTVGIDARVSGQIADYTFDLTGMYMTSRESDHAEGSSLNNGQKVDGLYASAEVGLTKGLSLTAAYRSMPTPEGVRTTGDTDDERLATIGARLSISDQTSLASWYTSYLSQRSGDYTSDGAFTLLFISNF